MNAKRLLEMYEQISEAPNAITLLRRFVLDLAARGALLDQNAIDEPAAVSLTRIEAEKEERVARGEIRRGKLLADLEEKPFELPDAWLWVPLGKTGHIFTGNSINAVKRTLLMKTSEGLPFIATKDVGYGIDMINYENGLLVPEGEAGFKVARANTVFICAEGGSAGKKIGQSDRKICFGNKLIANETWSDICPDFVRYIYLSDFFHSEFRSKMTGVIGGISLRNFLQLPFPLPPLAEQHRIVAKLNELMGLCDRLADARKTSEESRNKFTGASLSRLTATDTPPEDFPAHARFALDSLPALTCRPDQIDDLRQTILNLAVTGKLVEQDTADGLASELLEDLKEKKKELLLGRSFRADKPLPAVTDEETPFSLPSGWKWCRAQEVSLKISDGVHKKPQYVDNGIPFVTVKNLTEGKGISFRDTKFITEEDHLEFIKRTHPENGDVLITKDGTIGVTRVVETGRQFSIFVSVALIKMIDKHLSPFLALCLNSELVQAQIVPKGAALKHLHLVDLRNLPLPLAPLAEQRRIVAKVDALMALCDRLEAALNDADTTRTYLLEALLHEALSQAETEMEAAE